MTVSHKNTPINQSKLQNTIMQLSGLDLSFDWMKTITFVLICSNSLLLLDFGLIDSFLNLSRTLVTMQELQLFIQTANDHNLNP